MQKTAVFSLYLGFIYILFLVSFNYSLTNMAAPYIVGALGDSNDVATYTITFFSIGNALGIPLGKPLAEHLGPVKSLIICLILFILFSCLCGVVTNYPLFLATRFFVGFAAGPFYPLVTTLFFHIFPKEKNAGFLSLSLSIFTLVPVIGACWGGWISYDYNWQWLFYFNIPFLLLVTWFIHHKLKDISVPLVKTSFDGIGYIFYSLGIFCLSFVITTGQELDWFRSSFITALTLIGAASLLFFIFWDLKQTSPLLNLKLMKNSVFSYALVNLAVLFAAYFGMSLLLGLWLNLYADYTPLWIGLLIGNMVLASILPPFIMKQGNLFDCRTPLMIALVFFAISSFYTTIFNVDINFGRIAFSRVLAGFGLAFFLPPLFRLCFESFPEQERPNIINLFQVVRTLSSGLGAAIYTTIWLRRRVFYHDRLGAELTPFSPETQNFFSRAQDFHLQGEAAKAKLEYLLDRQATSLALNDCFYLMGWVMVGLVLLLLLTLALPRIRFYPGKEV